MMSVFDDSDDDLMIPLAQRLGYAKPGLVSSQPDVVCLSSSSSSSVAEATAPVSQKTDQTRPLRRCLTLNDFAPVTKHKKDNTPQKPPDTKAGDQEASLSNSFSSCLTISSESSGKRSAPVSSSPEPAFIIRQKQSSTPKINSSSQLSNCDPVPGTSKSKARPAAGPSQQRDKDVGRAPAKKISERDCLALVSDKFLIKHFKDPDIRKVFSEHEVRFRYDSSPRMDYAVTFAREIVNEYGCKEEKIEDQVLVMVQKEEFVQMVDAYRQKKNSPTKSTKSWNADDNEDVIPISDSDVSFTDSALNSSSSSGKTVSTTDLIDYVSKIAKLYPKMHITLIIVGMMAYFRSQRKKMDESYENFMRGKKPSKKKRKTGLPDVSQNDVTAALTDLHLGVTEIMSKGYRVNCYQYERMPDVLKHIASFTKSVAEAPTIRARTEMNKMDWFAENDKKGSVDLKDLEKDSLRLWRKQLEQFPRVSREIADAIINIYPTVTSLRRAYDRIDDACGTILLQDIPVGKNKRRIGPDISRKIHLFFTSTDGEIFLAKQS